MDECSKSKKIWGQLEWDVLQGDGIDIGCGPDPVSSNCRRFDVEHGDANKITDYVTDTFDFVFSSHCLEHMHNPRSTLHEWWKLVKVGGYLFFIVPDEDLYEQGVFPSRFNTDHKATFTISKSNSWSERSINVLELVHDLPFSRLIRIELQDHGYDRALYRHGSGFEYISYSRHSLHMRIKSKLQRIFNRLGLLQSVVDQTQAGALAQIACIVQKVQ